MRSLLVVSLSTLLLAACGQTGSLYLPKDAPKSAPASAVKAQAPVETAADQPAAAVDTQAR